MIHDSSNDLAHMRKRDSKEASKSQIVGASVEEIYQQLDDSDTQSVNTLQNNIRSTKLAGTKRD
jgi:hypothetical protein